MIYKFRLTAYQWISCVRCFGSRWAGKHIDQWIKTLQPGKNIKQHRNPFKRQLLLGDLSIYSVAPPSSLHSGIWINRNTAHIVQRQFGQGVSPAPTNSMTQEEGEWRGKLSHLTGSALGASAVPVASSTPATASRRGREVPSVWGRATVLHCRVLQGAASQQRG